MAKTGDYHELPYAADPERYRSNAPDIARTIHYLKREPPTYVNEIHASRVPKFRLDALPAMRVKTQRLKKRRHRVVAFGVCYVLYTHGGLASRLTVYNRVRSVVECVWRDEPHYRLLLRESIYAAKLEGWIGSITLPDGVPIGMLPGAPCPQCHAWLTPKRIEEIAALKVTPYSEATQEVWAGDLDARPEPDAEVGGG